MDTNPADAGAGCGCGVGRDWVVGVGEPYSRRRFLRDAGLLGRELAANTNHQKTPSNALPMTFYYR
jgi:hypothetical protein